MEAYSYRYDELTASRTKMAQPDMPELVVGSQLTGGSGYRIDYAWWDISPRRFMTIRINTFSPLPFVVTVLPVLPRRLAGVTSGL